jgi:uncharacterized protein
MAADAAAFRNCAIPQPAKSITPGWPVQLLDIHTCRCSQYQQRHILVHDCLELTPANIRKLRWLPRTCAYRLVAENKELPSWHPLISGDPQSVHAAGISVRQLAISEQHVHPDNFEKYRVKERF